MGEVTDPKTGDTSACCNDFVHWHIPDGSNIIGAIVAFQGKDPFSAQVLHYRWDHTSDYIWAEPMCVRWDSEDKKFPYDFCVTVKTSSNRQPMDEVSIAGKGSLNILKRPAV